MCSLGDYGRLISLRRAVLACSCVSGGCSDCRDDRRLQAWIHRGRDVDRWNEYGPREHSGQCPVRFLVSGRLGRVSGRRSPGALCQRAGLGAVPAFRRFGDAAVPDRHRTLLRAVIGPFRASSFSDPISELLYAEQLLSLTPRRGR